VGGGGWGPAPPPPPPNPQSPIPNPHDILNFKIFKNNIKTKKNLFFYEIEKIK